MTRHDFLEDRTTQRNRISYQSQGPIPPYAMVVTQKVEAEAVMAGS